MLYKYCPFCKQNTEHKITETIIHGIKIDRRIYRCGICGAEHRDRTEELMSDKFVIFNKHIQDDVKGLANQSHYTKHKIQPLDVIEDWDLPHHLACVIKYIGRAGLKPGNPYWDDIGKAKVYIDRYIEKCKRLEDNEV